MWISCVYFRFTPTQLCFLVTLYPVVEFFLEPYKIFEQHKTQTIFRYFERERLFQVNLTNFQPQVLNNVERVSETSRLRSGFWWPSQGL